MKTVGQFLHSARNQKNLSVDELSRVTKIDTKYITALEADRYDLLPSETFAKGFIRNLCRELDTDPNEYIAIFRRDYKNPDPKKNTKSIPHRSIFRFPHTSPQVITLVLGIIVFVSYLVFQFRAIIAPPPLTVESPLSGSVIISPVEIVGKTTTDSLVSINDENVIKPDQDGKFQIFLNLPVGETNINIKTTNRFSRSTTKTISLTVISK